MSSARLYVILLTFLAGCSSIDEREITNNVLAHSSFSCKLSENYETWERNTFPRIEAMLECGDNPLAKEATKALEAVFRVYQQAAANVPDSFWEDHA